MRLKQHDQPFAFERARRFKRRFDLGGMMTVIVHHGVVAGLQPDLESSPGPAERFERFRDLVKRHSNLRGQRNDAQCITDVVSTRNSKGQSPETLICSPNFKTRSGRSTGKISISIESASRFYRRKWNLDGWNKVARHADRRHNRQLCR